MFSKILTTYFAKSASYILLQENSQKNKNTWDGDSGKLFSSFCILVSEHITSSPWLEDS